MANLRLTPRRVVDARERARSADRQRAAEWLWFSALSLLLVMVVVGALSAAAAVSPDFCAVCHSDVRDALAGSKHAGFSCDSCHRRAGTTGLVENRLWVAGMVLEAPVRSLFPTGAKPAIDSRRCAQCHAPQLAATLARNGVLMSHRAPVDAAWSCTRCHREAGHPESGVSYAIYTMGGCLSCHSTGKGALSTCSTCHVDGAKPSAPRALPTAWAVTHGKGWEQTHGMGDLSTCVACHPSNYCARCHDVELPHPPNYLSVHGEDVDRLGGTATCDTCHRPESCEGCHGVDMPHPDEFLNTHKTEAQRLGEEACHRCHAKSSCESCHDRHTHPGLSPERVEELKERPVKVE